MKKYFLVLLVALPIVLSAQQKPDTITLKNGKSVTGYIYKMDDGKIYVAAKDSSVYTADEVQSIMFCHDAKMDCNPSAALTDITAAVEVNNKATDENSATVIFKCTQCGNKGSLKIDGGTKQSKSASSYSFNGKGFTQQEEHLVPGEYDWSYAGSNGKEMHGKFTIRKGEQKEIVLFEKANKVRK